MIYVAIIDDEADFRSSIEVLINSAPDLKCVGSYESCEEALRQLPDDVPDVILLDIGLPGMSGIEGVFEIKKKLPECEIIMLTIQEREEAVFESLRNGASGYLIKNADRDELIRAIHEACNGGAPMSTAIARRVVEHFRHKHILDVLTAREHEILRYLSQGKSYKSIANEVNISLNTVKYHIKNIYQKLQVHSWPELASLLRKEKGV